MREKCLDCHKEVASDVRGKMGYHGRIAERECRTCHTEHRGRDAKVVLLDEKTRKQIEALVEAEQRHLAAQQADLEGRQDREAAASPGKLSGRRSFLPSTAQPPPPQGFEGLAGVSTGFDSADFASVLGAERSTFQSTIRVTSGLLKFLTAARASAAGGAYACGSAPFGFTRILFGSTLRAIRLSFNTSETTTIIVACRNAASSARTSRTCCDDCSASAASMAPSRCSSAAPRRSRTPA